MYRPKNWAYQHARSGDWDNAPNNLKWDIPHSIGWRDGYEAGADDMLEELKGQTTSVKMIPKKREWTLRLWLEAETGMDKPGWANVNMEPQEEGWLVFIPDEQVKKDE